MATRLMRMDPKSIVGIYSSSPEHSILTIVVLNGTYYLYGNSFALKPSAFGIKSYSSVDLTNWYAKQQSALCYLY